MAEGGEPALQFLGTGVLTRNRRRILERQFAVRSAQNIRRATNQNNTNRNNLQLAFRSQSFPDKLDTLCNMATDNEDAVSQHSGDERPGDSDDERPVDPVQLQINDLTLQLTRQNREVVEILGKYNNLENMVQGLATNVSRLLEIHQSTPNPTPRRINPTSGGSSGNQSNERFNKLDLSKWHIKYDGSGKEMTVESFIFRVEKMAETHNIPLDWVFKKFHCLLTGNAAKWFWQLVEDNKDNAEFGYESVKAELLRNFKTSQTDCEIIRELVERKQQPNESFEDFYAEIHNISFRLHNKMSEKELVDIIKNNLRGHLATMIFPCAVKTLSELKAECKKAERVWRDSRPKGRPVNELQWAEYGDAASSNVKSIEAFNANSHSQNHQKSDPNKNSNAPMQKAPAFNNTRQETNNKNPTQKPSLCPSPFHLNLCFKCGMPVDYYKKNSVSNGSVCENSFHKIKCYLCAKSESYCVYEGTVAGTLNRKVAEVSGSQSQSELTPEN